MDCRKGRLEPASERLVYNRKIHGCGVSRPFTPNGEETVMTKLRQIVKDAYKCDELRYQFDDIDTSDGLLSWDDPQADVNEKYSDEYIIKEAEHRLYLSKLNIEYADGEDLRIHKKEARQLERFLAKHKTS